MIFTKVQEYVSSFIDLIYPEQCPGCQNLLYENEPLCRFCEAGLPRTNSHHVEHPLIDKNIKGRIQPKQAYSYFHYVQKGISQNLIYNIKYKKRPEVAEYLGYRYSLELMEKGLFLDENYTLVPVPLHPKKMASRGFNQSEEICKGISKAYGFYLAEDALLKTKNTRSQTTKDRDKRWLGIKDSFEYNPNFHNVLKNKNVILVDDILTTGATIEACYNELLKAQPKSISIITLAIRL